MFFARFVPAQQNSERVPGQHRPSLRVACGIQRALYGVIHFIDVAVGMELVRPRETGAARRGEFFSKQQVSSCGFRGQKELIFVVRVDAYIVLREVRHHGQVIANSADAQIVSQ